MTYLDEAGYLKLVENILNYGEERSDRTGVGTKALFGVDLKFGLQNGFPALTTKKLAWKSVVSELLWFIEGSSDERRLAEILHGSRDSDKSTIWTPNATAPYWKNKAQFEGDLGRVYGVQWRHWKKPDGTEIDQLATLIHTLKTNPTDRRMILTAMNVGEFDQMALPPCHMFAQFFVYQKKYLCCQVYIRSSDVFLGLPFNIASYALLVHMIAQVTNLEAMQLRVLLGDTHLYLNHLDVAQEQIQRKPYSPPTLEVVNRGQTIDDFVMDDFKLVDYKYHPALKAEMAV